MRFLLLTFCLLFSTGWVLSSEPASPAEEKGTWNRPVPEWWEGPVRYLLTDDEVREYRSLSNSAERASLIARFWASRDLDPFTPGNLAEEIFWERVSAADELFTLTTISGWRTDQGRIYILLGPPDEITNYPLPSMDELDPTHFPDPYRRWPDGELRPGARGAVEWVYRSLTDPRATAGQKVTFIRDEGGEFRISGTLATTFRFEPEWLNLSYHEALQAGAQGGRGGSALPRGSSGDSGSGASRNAPDAYRTSLANSVESVQQAMTSAEDLFAWGQADLFQKAEPSPGPVGRVSTAQIFGVIALQDRVDFFQGSGGTHALITLGIPVADLKARGEDAPSSLEVFGRLEMVGDPTHVYQFSSTRATTEVVPVQEVGGREHRLYQIRGIVPPGPYRANFGARIGERIGAVGEQVLVPDFGGDSLTLAGPILAEKIGSLATPGGPRGFAVGKLRMLPKLEPVFSPGSEFGFYFQIYHAQPDPRDGRLHLDIQYSVAARQKRIFVAQGKPVSLVDNDAAAHGFCFPLTGWSAGEYLLTVTVTDRQSGAVRAGTAAFLVQ
jgi:GWxTD domain-containing protein